MAPLLLIAGIPILSIALGVIQKENINVFLMGFFRDLGRIKANKRRSQNSNAVVAMDGATFTTWDIIFGRDDPLAGIDFSAEGGGDESQSSTNGSEDGTGTGTSTGTSTSSSSDSTSSRVTFTAKELEEFGNGKNGNPIYLSVFGRVYDVTAGKKFYGPESKYGMFAGKDVTRGLCLGCKAPECLVRSTEGLSERQINEAKRWLSFFQMHDKYYYVGNLESVDSEAWLDALIADTVEKTNGDDDDDDEYEYYEYDDDEDDEDENEQQLE